MAVRLVQPEKVGSDLSNDAMDVMRLE